MLFLSGASLAQGSAGGDGFTTSVTVANDTSGGPPFWGCEASDLPPGSMHVVVSTYNAEPEQLLPWIWHLGLTNAAVFVYHRLNNSDGSLAALYDSSVVRLPCNMSLTVLPLLPNKGREAAVFLHHIVTHYERLPMALMLVHDHGPASRHSLCGPFYRRARGYYRGLVERARAAAAGAGAGAARLGVFGRFAGMVATLSSGCVETWARGCCAAFVCSGSAAACPFQHANCTTHVPGGRQLYLHAHGMYDPRFENQVVLGPAAEAAAGEDGGGGGGGAPVAPVALLRYVGAAHTSAAMWNISHEYPPSTRRLTPKETLGVLRDLLARYDFPARRRKAFKSCCASLMLRDQHVRRWPAQLYRELLEYSMDPLMDYEATKAVSGPGWALWAEREYGRTDVLEYLRVDLALKAMQGCPAQRSPAMVRLTHAMRARAAAATGQGGAGGVVAGAVGSGGGGAGAGAG